MFIIPQDEPGSKIGVPYAPIPPLVKHVTVLHRISSGSPLSFQDKAFVLFGGLLFVVTVLVLTTLTASLLYNFTTYELVTCCPSV